MWTNKLTSRLFAVRLVIVIWIAGWCVKWIFFAPYLGQITRDVLIAHPLFPEFWRDPAVSAVFYFLPVLAAPLVFLREVYVRGYAFVMVVCSAGLAVHVNTHNDATFVTSFWIALWVLWLAFQKEDGQGEWKKQACRLALAVVGMVFLGGFVGKLTPEYWSGEVMRNILETSSQHSPLGRVLAVFSIEEQAFFIKWISRFVIVLEGLMACAMILPVRLVFFLMYMILFGFMIFSTWMILSVLLCLWGMLLACLFLEDRPAR